MTICIECEKALILFFEWSEEIYCLDCFCKKTGLAKEIVIESLNNQGIHYEVIPVH